MLVQESEKVVKPALLTRSEIEWLSGKKQASQSYARFMKSMIKAKLETYVKFRIAPPPIQRVDFQYQCRL